jgi:hypothetical protein
MHRFPSVENPPLAPGTTSIILGTMGLALFGLPILGMPLAATGLVIGLLALPFAWRRDRAQRRWLLAGVGLSAMALGMIVAIDYAPEGYVRTRTVPRLWQEPNDRPYVPPPALDLSHPGGGTSAAKHGDE